MTEEQRPVQWLENERVLEGQVSSYERQMFPEGITKTARDFHQQIPGYKMSPLKNLPRLASRLGLGGIWVKDESNRLRLGSFKVLGGSFAIYQAIRERLGMMDRELTYEELTSPEIRAKLGDIVFAAATDGNHGRGVAWSATQLGFRSIIYVHKLTSAARIEAIQKNGAKVVVIDGTYDDAVHQVNVDAKCNGWQVIADTAWEGYEDIPRWVIQGYSTMLAETQEQLAAQGLIRPTHLFVQAGVGSLAAATIGYYTNLFGSERPTTVVVEPDRAACLYHSAEVGDGAPHNFEGNLDTIMAGLACGDPNPIAWDLLKETTDYFVKSPDYVAAKGMRVYGVPLAGDPFIVSGESGAVTLGVLMFIMQLPELVPLREKLGLGPDSQVLLVNSEGNTDPDDFRRVVWEGGSSVPKQYRHFHSGLGPAPQI
ncbi:MAG: diaminopropionate ammonia-lyase [Anaerolineaceae bacterium]|nr:diaminopropionate ammonia-lyase [Anaerolineaceae bacterium]